MNHLQWMWLCLRYIWLLFLFHHLCPLLVCIGCVVLLCLLLFSWPASVEAAPNCMNDQAGCSIPALANLFDRVIQHSSRMHSITNDLHSDFVSMPVEWVCICVCVCAAVYLQKAFQNNKQENTLQQKWKKPNDMFINFLSVSPYLGSFYIQHCHCYSSTCIRIQPEWCQVGAKR